MLHRTDAIPALATMLLAAAVTAQDVVHFESAHVHPLERTPDGARILAVNTEDGRLELFEPLPASPWLRAAGAIAVGLEPVTVRARTSAEAWVVNHVSDSISIVDLQTMEVRATIHVGDEPTDVVFAGSPPRAFISVGGEHRVLVLDAADPGAPGVAIPLGAASPRALAVDGARVIVTTMGGARRTTVVSAAAVSGPASPYPGSPNPPPNAGAAFDPPMNPATGPAPAAGLVVRRDAAGAWRDVNGADWSASVPGGLPDRGAVAIDAGTLAVTDVTGLMGAPLGLAPMPGGGVLAVGLDARNELRFERHVNSVFVRSAFVRIAAGAVQAGPAGDLNPHLTYRTRTLPPLVRATSIGDPRGVLVAPDGSRAWVTGLGSSNVAAFDPATGARLGCAAVGEGPTGLALDVPHGRLVTLDRFGGSLTVLDAATLSVLGRVRYFDPTPRIVREGRPILFDTLRTSGLGQASCATCHIDGRSDGLAWDLGNPQDGAIEFNQVCNLALPASHEGCGPWHPVKGPMVTQSLIGMSGTEPFHWRGDRAYIANFAHTAETLQGLDTDFTEQELKDLQDYLTVIAPMPNPYRGLDGRLPATLGGGDPARGEALFRHGNLGFVNCEACHAGATGAGAAVVSADLMGGPEPFAVPHLAGLRDKAALGAQLGTRRAFGYGHDGVAPTIEAFLGVPGTHFNGAMSAAGTDARDLAAFLLCWEGGTHAAVGAQATVVGNGSPQLVRRGAILAAGAAGSVQVTARARSGGRQRAWLLQSGIFVGDEAGTSTTLAGLDALAAGGTPVTFTAVPAGTGLRAIDRDGDGALDGDELAACRDPADPASVPGGPVGCRADLAGGDARVDGNDLGALLAVWGGGTGPADLDCSGTVDGGDLAALLASWGACR